MLLAVRRRQNHLIRIVRLGNLTSFSQSREEEEEEEEETAAGRRDGEVRGQGAAGGEVGNGNVRGNTLRVGGVDCTVRRVDFSPGVRTLPVGRGGHMLSRGRGARALRGFGPNWGNAHAYSTHRLSLASPYNNTDFFQPRQQSGPFSRDEGVRMTTRRGRSGDTAGIICLTGNFRPGRYFVHRPL